jgi:hypothetical protein
MQNLDFRNKTGASLQSSAPSLAESAFVNESIERITVWLYGAGGTPSEKFIRIDYDPDGEHPSALPIALSALGRLAPALIVPGYVMRLDHDIQQSCVLLRLQPRETKSVRPPKA